MAAKRGKLAGGRPVLSKKVTIDMDSEDEMIVRLKAARYPEKEIYKRLVDAGKTHYSQKTIATRYCRLKKMLERHNEEMLDAELTDWHEGDVRPPSAILVFQMLKKYRTMFCKKRSRELKMKCERLGKKLRRRNGGSSLTT